MIFAGKGFPVIGDNQCKDPEVRIPDIYGTARSSLNIMMEGQNIIRNYPRNNGNQIIQCIWVVYIGAVHVHRVYPWTCLCFWPYMNFSLTWIFIV